MRLINLKFCKRRESGGSSVDPNVTRNKGRYFRDLTRKQRRLPINRIND